jgi:iron complex outermembrane receptor protein
MKKKLNLKIRRAVLAALGTTAYSAVPWVAAEEQSETTDIIETIVVTATRREANIQDVPAAVFALSGSEITARGIGGAADLIQALTQVTAADKGPGQASIYMRGLAVEPVTITLVGTQGSMPNVALYLDDMPVTAPGRNVDLYPADLERVEVLSGPQGTLFGASSQAGTIRYISNKPHLDAFEAGFTASYSTTTKGSDSGSVEGFVNLPFGDTVALRAAVYSVNNGGYIDNVYSTFTTDPSINPDSAIRAGANSYRTAVNSDFVAKDFNDSSYRGLRVGLKYEPNDDWEFLLSHSRQEIQSDGVFDYDPAIGDLEVARFSPDSLKDSFELTSWTVEGRLGALEVLYTGAHFTREIEQHQDYIGYNNVGFFTTYYTCTYTPAFLPGDCLDPGRQIVHKGDHERDTHEIRVSITKNRWRAIGGLFYDDYKIVNLDEFYYAALEELGFFQGQLPFPGARNSDPNPRNNNIGPFDDVTRTSEEIAVFAEVAFDLTDSLSLSLGGRYYDLELDFYGGVGLSFGDGVFGPSGGTSDVGYGRDFDVSCGHTDKAEKFDGFLPKVTLSYAMGENGLFYATYSKGYRMGGFNRVGGCPNRNPAFPIVGITYDTDDVINYEFGWKSRLLDGRMIFNGNVYRINWTDMQVSRYDPANIGDLVFIQNAADAEITGVDLDVQWHMTDNWSVIASATLMDTELTDTFGSVLELIPKGSSLPLSPDEQVSLRVRYEFSDGRYDYWVEPSLSYSSDTISHLLLQESVKQSSYSLVNLSMGVQYEQWRTELYVNNLTDERAELWRNIQDDIPRITTNRPRTIGLRFSWVY